MTSDNSPNISAQAKKRRNAINCVQVKISTNPEVASAFKTACIVSGASMASVLTQFMAQYSNTAILRKPKTPDYSTRRQRRTALRHLGLQLEQIKAAEEHCRDSTPENLQGSVVFEKADELVALLDEAIELINFIY